MQLLLSVLHDDEIRPHLELDAPFSFLVCLYLLFKAQFWVSVHLAQNTLPNTEVIYAFASSANLVYSLTLVICQQ